MPKSVYFVRNQLVGEREFAKAPLSFAYFCSTCGEIWARIWTEGEPFRPHAVPCEKHQPVGVWDWSTIPGSLVLWDTHALIGYPSAATALDCMPEAVLRRETAIHLAYWEKQQHGEQDSSNAGP